MQSEPLPPAPVPEKATTDPDAGTGPQADAALNGHDAAAPSGQRKSLAFNLSFVGVALVSFVFSLDATTLAVALPAIAEQLEGTTLESFWANISYLLCVVVMQPLYTTVSDVFGRKMTLFFGLFMFALGSLIFAVAQNMTTVIVGRVLQGLGGGGMDLMAEIIVADMTTLQERSLYLGLLALPIAVGSILGPTLGAIFTAHVSWRWIGWVNLPILGLAALLLCFFLRLRQIRTSTMGQLRKLDWGGILLSLVGTTIFVVPLSWADALYPWRSWETLLPLILGAFITAAFMVYEFRVPEFPIFPRRLFVSKTVSLTLLANFIHGASLYSLLQYLPLFYQAVKQDTTIQSAVTLLPTSIVSVVFAAAGVIIVGVIGKGYCWAIRTFWAGLTLGTGILAFLDAETSESMLLGLPVLWGAAIGALMRLLHLPIQASVENIDDTGLVIGLLLMVRLLGGVVGLALSSSVFNSVFADSLRGVDLQSPLDVLQDPSKAIGFIPQLRDLQVSADLLDVVLQAYAAAMRAIFYSMTGLSAVGLLTSIFSKDASLSRTELGRQAFED